MFASERAYPWQADRCYPSESDRSIRGIFSSVTDEAEQTVPAEERGFVASS